MVQTAQKCSKPCQPAFFNRRDRRGQELNLEQQTLTLSVGNFSKLLTQRRNDATFTVKDEVFDIKFFAPLRRRVKILL